MLQNPNFVFRKIYGKALLMPVRRNDVGNEPIHLNEIASEIWNKAGDCVSFNELLQSITDLYDLAQNSAEQSAVKQFIDELADLKLISEQYC